MLSVYALSHPTKKPADPLTRTGGSLFHRPSPPFEKGGSGEIYRVSIRSRQTRNPTYADIKRAFTAQIPDAQRPAVFGSRERQGEQAIWQRRFWEHRIRDERDFAHHVHYIHYNPVKHGLVNRPVDWPYSRIHRAIRQGMIPADWGGDPIEIADSVGHE